jgi:hypothetical protein
MSIADEAWHAVHPAADTAPEQPLSPVTEVLTVLSVLPDELRALAAELLRVANLAEGRPQPS